MNAGLQASFFWDGRASSLEQQALMPIVNPLEMDLHIDEAVKRLKANSLYNTAFQKLFGVRPNAVNLAAALSAFERTLEASNSPLDDWRLNKNESAVSATVKRGFALFQGKGNCMKCHSGQNFTNSEFRNIGLFDGRALIDSGRAGITKNPQDLGKFKTGSLRNVAITAPYMHNGMFKTLRQVIDYYNDPDKIIPRAIGRDPLLSQPLYLSENEKTDLENFLVSLTDKRFNLKNENL
jgi:cytochrome c peroxidase